MAQAAGYVVISGGGEFLSRSKRWVRHRNRRRGLPGNMRAWVHPAEAITPGSPWEKEAYKIQPAMYDKDADHTVILGDPIDYRAFIRSLQQT